MNLSPLFLVKVVTDVVRMLNARTTTQTQTQTGIIEVLSVTEVFVTEERVQRGFHFKSAFVAVVGRPMRRIDVERLALFRNSYSDSQIEAGIFIAGIRAAELSLKPKSLAYFEKEIENTKSAGIGNLTEYIGYLKDKLSRVKANGHGGHE